jgi:hypothetical protein
MLTTRTDSFNDLSFFASEQAATEGNYSSNKKMESALVDLLGATVWKESDQQTFGYRWKGQDTLTYGDPTIWIRNRLVQDYILDRQILDVADFARQIDQVFSSLNRLAIAFLTRSFVFRNETEITDFLMTHPDLISVLIDARTALEKYFGEGTEIALEVTLDPEIPGFKQLFGYIQTGNLTPEEAMERLNALDEGWFLKQAEFVGGLFNFNLE